MSHDSPTPWPTDPSHRPSAGTPQSGYPGSTGPGWQPSAPPPAWGNIPPQENGAPYSPGPYWGSPPQPKPPVIPFHPLKLGDLIDGTFAAIRSNPKVMFTISLGVMGIVGIISGILSALIPFDALSSVTVGGSGTEYEFTMMDAMGAISSLGTEGVMGLVSSAASLLVTGMLVLSVTNAVVGVNLDLRATWEQLKPHFWRLIGTAILVWLSLAAIVVVTLAIPGAFSLLIFAGSNGNDWWPIALLFLITIPVMIALLVWVGTRLYFATMVAVVEGARPGTALSRSWTLTRGAFWRTFGRLILIGVIVGIAVSLLSGTISMIIAFMAGVIPWPIVAFLLSLITALVSGLAIPVSAAYGSLMYVDERIRKENLGPALQAAVDQARGAQ